MDMSGHLSKCMPLGGMEGNYFRQFSRLWTWTRTPIINNNILSVQGQGVRQGQGARLTPPPVPWPSPALTKGSTEKRISKNMEGDEMNKQRLIAVIETMMADKNYMINSGKGTSQQKYAWEYARENLKIVLNYIKELETEKP